MSVYDTHTRTYVCDRGGETAEIEGNGVAAPVPPGWTPLLYGSGYFTAIIPRGVTEPLGVKATWLCPDCSAWHRAFLQGRKVVD